MNIQAAGDLTQLPRPLAGKVAAITGSTSGIGLGIARALAAAGADIVLNGFGQSDEIEKTRHRVVADFGVRTQFSPPWSAAIPVAARQLT